MSLWRLCFPQPPAWQEELHLFAEAYNTMLPEAANEAARRAKEEKSRSLWAGKPAGRPVARQKALSMLGRVERWVYDWFSTHADRDVLVDPEWAAMRQFLNQIQDERIALVEMDIDDPPLANFAELEKTDQEHVRRIWADLVSEKHWWNKTGIAIEGTKAARVRILADFSRLLETETGRMVVGALSAGPKLTITPRRTPSSRRLRWKRRARGCSWSLSRFQASSSHNWISAGCRSSSARRCSTTSGSAIRMPAACL